MRRISRRLPLRAIEAAVLIVLLCAFSAAAAESQHYFAKAKKPKKPAYAIESSHAKKPLIDKRNVAPGDSGTATITLRNVGTKTARVTGRRMSQTRSGLDAYLQVSIYDSTTRECIYPAPKKAKPKPPKKGKPALRPKASGPCKVMGKWSTVPRTFNMLPIIKGKYMLKGAQSMKWKTKERHRVTVRWQLLPTAPIGTQALRSSFTLRYTSRKK